MRWAFEEYSKGECTVDQLSEALADKGLRGPATKNRPAAPMHSSRVHAMLRNRYYIGVVSFRGVEYPGIHDTFVTNELFEKVQTILSTHAFGEKQREHPHYLKSTVYSGRCGSRLCLTNANDRYLYFFCVGRAQRRTHCTQRYVLADDVEVAIEQFYGQVQLTISEVSALRTELHEHLGSLGSQQAAEAKRQAKRLTDLRAQRAKLLHAHYADAIPLELLKTEQQRIAREIADAEHVVSLTQTRVEDLAALIGTALALVENCQAACRSAPDTVRRLFNQTFFEKLYVVDGEVQAADFHPTFGALMGNQITLSNEKTAGTTYARRSDNSGGFSFSQSSKEKRLVRPARSQSKSAPQLLRGSNKELVAVLTVSLSNPTLRAQLERLTRASSKK